MANLLINTTVGGNAVITTSNIGTYALTSITSGNVTTALGFTPYNATNPSGYISSITSGNVTTALGYTPYNATNPSGYITSSSLSSYLPLAGGTMSGKVYTLSTGTGTYDGAFEIRETSYVTTSQSAWGYAPGITYHWGGRVVSKVGLRSDGLFAIDNEPFATYSWVNSQGFQSASTAITTSNIGSQSVSYATNSGNSATTSQTTFSSLAVNNTSTWFGGYGGGSGPGIALENLSTFARFAFWGLDFYDWNHGIQMTIDNAYVSATNSFRAPIFYDSVDTTYYLDPNSNSYLSTLRVANATSGVSLHVGLGSTHGVYTGDNDRKYLVVSATYYPHMALVATSSNDSSHGAVFSFVGSESGAARQWNMGIANSNPFVFSIGYNRTGDNNPHYGIGDGWHGDDNHHARLSIDRDGNTKIRGMLYINGTSGGISTGSAVIHAGNIGSQSVSYASTAGALSSMNISQFSNNSGYLTGITSGQVTGALGYTPYNASNPSSYITSGDTTTGIFTTFLGNATSNIGSGYTRVIRNENGAGGAPNYAPILHVAASDTMWQIAGAHAGQTTLVWRSGYSGAWNTPWWTIYHSGNFTDNSSNWNTAYNWGNHASAGYQAASTAITTSNIGSQSVSNATTAGGLAVHGGRNNEANKIVRTDVNGYLQTGWINTPSGAFGSAINKIYCSDDDYVRYQTPANFISNLGLITTSSIGNQSVSYAVTAGSAGSVTGLTLNNSASGINPDNVTQNQIGYNTSVSLFGQTDGGLYSSAYSSSWIHQIYGDFRTGQIAIRGKNSGSWQAWRVVLDSSNYTSYAPSLTGSGASGSWGISVTGSAGSVAWTNVSSRPTALSQFSNDLGNYGGFLTSITAHSHAISDVTGLQTALDGKQASLGFTPYNSTNPSGYITSSGSISGNSATATALTSMNISQFTNNSGYITGYTETNTFLGDGGNADTHPGTSRLIFTGQISSGAEVLGMPANDNSNAFLNINRHSGEYNSQLGFSSNGSMYYRSFSATVINNSQAWRQVWDSGNLTNLNQLTNGPGYITSSALSGYATQSWVNSQGFLTSLPSHNHDDRYYTETEINNFSYWRNNEERTIKILRFTGEGGDSANTTQGYAIYQAGGAWTHPYPDLRIAFHTGIQIGANSSYGGTRFYNEYDMATELMSVGNGDNHVRVANSLYVGGNLALHAGNYNSYSPTLTGGNASGTWSINITGSAGSAGNTATIDSNPNRTDSTAYPVVWSNGSSQSPNYSCAAVTIQSSTGKLTATSFTGAGTGLTGTAASLSIGGNAATATTATNFNNGTSYSSAGVVYVDTLESVNTNDWLELTYYGGVGVRIGTGTNGSKALYAGSLYDAGNRVYSAGNPQVNITGNAATATNVAWTGVTSRPTALSQFSNDLGNYGGFLTSLPAHDHDRLFLTDSRGASRAPSYYDQRYAQWDFQSNSDTGAGGDGWHGLLTVAKWSSYDASHRQEQLAFTGDDLKRRTATSDSAWGSWKTIIDSGNVGSQSVSYASTAGNAATATNVAYSGLTGTVPTWNQNTTGNAATATYATTAGSAPANGGNSATVGGYAVSGSVGANTVVIRDANNYIYAHYINSNVSETENPTINSFYTSNGDGWLRKSSVAHVKSQLGLGSMAYESSGTYQTVSGAINTGNIASQSVSYATISQQLTKFGDIYGQDWNSYFITAKLIVSNALGHTGANRPSDSYGYGTVLSYGETGGPLMQMYFPEDVGNTGGAYRALAYRSGYNGGWSPWKTVVNQVGNTCTVAGSNGTGLQVHSNVGYNQNPLTYFLLRGQADSSWKTFKILLTGDAGGQDIEFRRIAENSTDARMFYVPRGLNQVIFDYTVVQPSDSRLKDNLTPITNPVDKIKSLRGVEFDWNSGEHVGTHDVGLIAQDVEAVLPEAVTTQEDGYKNLAYTKVIPLLVEAMKEQQTMIEALRAEIELLKNK